VLVRDRDQKSVLTVLVAAVWNANVAKTSVSVASFVVITDVLSHSMYT
jgi:hypothetical protein